MMVWTFGGSLVVLEYGWGAQAFLEAYQSTTLYLSIIMFVARIVILPVRAPWYYLGTTWSLTLLWIIGRDVPTVSRRDAIGAGVYVCMAEVLRHAVCLCFRSS